MHADHVHVALQEHRPENLVVLPGMLPLVFVQQVSGRSVGDRRKKKVGKIRSNHPYWFSSEQQESTNSIAYNYRSVVQLFLSYSLFSELCG